MNINLEIVAIRQEYLMISDSPLWEYLMPTPSNTTADPPGFTVYEDPRIIEPVRRWAYGRYQRELLMGRRRWDQTDESERFWQEALVRRFAAAKMRLERNGPTACISTGYGPPSELLLALCRDRGLVAPTQVVLELREDKHIDDVLVYRVALFGTTHRRFIGASNLQIFRSAYAVPQAGGHLFCGNAAKARTLIQEMKEEQEKARAAAVQRAAARMAEAEAAARGAEEQAYRECEDDEHAILSAFE
jgi:hypothetical protein